MEMIHEIKASPENGMNTKKNQKDAICPCCSKISYYKWVLNENYWMCVYCGITWDEKTGFDAKQ